MSFCACTTIIVLRLQTTNANTTATLNRKTKTLALGTLPPQLLALLRQSAPPADYAPRSFMSTYPFPLHPSLMYHSEVYVRNAGAAIRYISLG